MSWITYTGYLLWEPQQNITNPDLTEATPLDQVQDTAMKTGTGEVVPGHNLIFTVTAAQVVMTHTETAPGQNIVISLQPPQELLMTLTLHMQRLQTSFLP